MPASAVLPAAVVVAEEAEPGLAAPALGVAAFEPVEVAVATTVRAAERGVATGVLFSLSLSRSNRLAPAGIVPRNGWAAVAPAAAAAAEAGNAVPVLPLRPTAPSAERRAPPEAVGVVAACA